MPEDDRPAQPTVPGSGREAGQRLRRVDRVDEDALGSGEEPRGRVGVGRPDAVAGPALVVGELDLGRVDGHPGQRLEAGEQGLDRGPELV